MRARGTKLKRSNQYSIVCFVVVLAAFTQRTELKQNLNKTSIQTYLCVYIVHWFESCLGFRIGKHAHGTLESLSSNTTTVLFSRGTRSVVRRAASSPAVNQFDYLGEMSNSKKKWSVEDTCTLIELYRGWPILWDAKNPFHKNKLRTAVALNEIGTALNTEPKEVERKLKNVYSQYARERRNYTNMKKSGAGRGFRAKWFGYTLMSFLHDKNNTARKSHDAELPEIQVDIISYLH